VLGNDSDPEGDDLTVSAVNGSGGDVGTQITLNSGALLTLNADGSYAYDPNGSFEGLGAGESGSDSVTYTAADGNGGTDQATVTVTINGVNDAPTASDDAATTDEDQPVTIDVLANDSDPEGALAPSTVAVQSGPSNGGTSVDATSGAVTYTPDTGFSGDDTFTYTVEDAAGAVSNTSTVTISVDAVNDAPEAVASIPDRSMEVGAPALQVTSLLATVFQDPEGDPLTLSVTSSDPSVLAASVNGQTVRLDPLAVGSAQVTVRASDGTASTSADPFTVTVTEASGNEMPSQHATAVVDPAAAGNPTEVHLGTTGLEAAFQNVQSSGAFDVDFFPGDNGAAAATAKRAAPAFVPGEQFANVSRYRWQMQAPGVTFDSVDVRFRLADADIAGVGDPATITIIQDANGDGDFETVPTNFSDAGTPSDSTDDVLIARGLTTFGTFHLASNSGDNPLPVELTAWTATVDGSAALLQWRTASETNNAGFEVLHQRPDARTYDALGFVEGAGTTQEPQSYRFRAGDLAPGTHRFQLRQVDTDGTATRSEPVTVTIEAERTLTLRATGPNPVRQATQFAFTVPQSGPAEVVLYNVLGQRIRTLYAETATVGRQQTVALAVQDLPSGTYFVRLSAPGGTRTQRIVVVR
jgi:VCBS repeat-containing protein